MPRGSNSQNLRLLVDWRWIHGPASEEERDENRRRKLKHLLGSCGIFYPPTEEYPQEPVPPGTRIVQDKAAKLYANAFEAASALQYERAVLYLSKAITLQPQQIELYVSQAEAYLQLCDFQSATICYKQVSVLKPGAFTEHLAFLYYLQGQCLFDQGFLLEALEAFSKAVEVKPGCNAYKVRSLSCMSALGRLSDCLKLVTGWMTLEGPTTDLYILRARLHRKLNQTIECYRDVKSALAITPTSVEANGLMLLLRAARDEAREKAVERALSSQLPEALYLVNMALQNSPLDAHLYLLRGILYRCLEDFTAAIEDLVQAVELSEEDEEEEEEGGEESPDPPQSREERHYVQKEALFQVVLTYNDFAIKCFMKGLYAEATVLLNKAIKEEKGQAGLYLNRGDCFFIQADWYYALADYQQAKELMQPNDPAVRLRLAIVHNTIGLVFFQDGQFQEAVDMFSLAIEYTPATTQYYENRAKAFRKLKNLDGARQDLICLLILDPDNEEVPSMLMNLFPGFSMSDVLSSPRGHVIRVQLMDTIQACSPSSDSINKNVP